MMLCVSVNQPQAETKVHEHTTEPEMPPLPAPPPPKAPQHASAPTSKPVKSNSTTQPSPEPFQEGLSESEALARAIEESLAIYNDTMTAKKVGGPLFEPPSQLPTSCFRPSSMCSAGCGGSVGTPAYMG